MADEHAEHLAYAGSGGEQWAFKVSCSSACITGWKLTIADPQQLLLPADANSDPYPKTRNTVVPDGQEAPGASRYLPRQHTRLPDEEDAPLVHHEAAGEAAVQRAVGWTPLSRGTPYRPREEIPSVDNYPLVPNDRLLASGSTFSPHLGHASRHSESLGRLDDPLDARPSFKLPEPKRRERAWRKLGDRASRSLNRYGTKLHNKQEPIRQVAHGR